MLILVHDYCGHPFQVQLSRWLAAQGHQVSHHFSADIQTPRGPLRVAADDPEDLLIEPLTIGRPLDKYNLVKRVCQERAYAQVLVRTIRDLRPEAVICSNTPPFILAKARKATQLANARFVTWVQDIFSPAFQSYVGPRLGPVATIAGWYLRHMEFGAIAASDAVVAITRDFEPLLKANGVNNQRLFVIENWAPADQIIPRPRNNPWACKFGLEDKFVFLYSGTLGLKHIPSLLSRLAEALSDRPEVQVVVISQGQGRDFLENEKRTKGLKNLLLFDFVPYETLPDVLGSADVLLTILEPSAGIFSVPSKVLSYICAGRAILGAVPPGNLAARTIEGAGAGCLVDPNDFEAFLTQAIYLYKDVNARRAHEKSAIAYAREKFDMEKIGRRFLQVLDASVNPVQ